MAVTQDGTQRFAIPNSPLTINSVTYIAEDLAYEQPSETVDIEDDEGTPTGQVIIDKKKRLTGTLQLATAGTAIPTNGQNFSFEGTDYYVESTTRNESQKAFAKVAFVAVEKIN